MLTSREIRFTESFLAALKHHEHVETFPIGNSDFINGVENMAKWIIVENEGLAFKYDLISLFSRVPLTGCYERFVEALGYLNGRSLGMENPRLVKATIKISTPEATKILQEDEEDLRSLIQQSVKEFIVGAGLNAAH